MLTQSNHKQTFRFVPSTSVPIDPKRVEEILKQEWELFTKGTDKSAEESRRSFKALPLGVTSSFQHWDPYPISIKSAKGAYMTDVDGRQLLDLSMGFGAMLAGHLNPIVVEEIETSLSQGMLFVTPSPISTDAAERICKRFGIDQVRLLTAELNQQCMQFVLHALLLKKWESYRSKAVTTVATIPLLYPASLH